MLQVKVQEESLTSPVHRLNNEGGVSTAVVTKQDRSTPPPVPRPPPRPRSSPVPPRRLISLFQVIFDAFLFFRALAPFTSVAAQTADGDVSAPRSPVVRCHVCPLLCPQVGIRLQDFWFLEQEVDKLHALVRGALGFLRFLFLSLPARLWKPEQPAVIFTLTW